KTGYSTDATTLEKLRGEHPIVEHLLRYREVEKLRSTYGEGLLAEVGADGRIHATFNQTVARTGRLSSDAPTSTTSPCGPRTAGASAAPSCRRRATRSSWPTTTRWSCAASPTWPRTRASSRPSPPAPTSTRRRRHGCSG